MSSSTRHSWIDICRGFGIILVLYGHGLNADSYRHLLYAFHMPLFFFLSGIVFQYKKQDHFLPFLKKNIKRILIPYFIFSFLSFLNWFVNLNNHTLSDGVIWQFLSIFYGNGNNGGLAFNIVLWFLPCLFVTRVGFWFVAKYVKGMRIVLILLVFSIIGYASSIWLSAVKLPFGIETAITAIVFFGVGYLWNVYFEKIKSVLLGKKAWYVLLLALFITIVVATLNYNIYGRQVDIRLNRIDNYYLFYLAAMSGILSCLTVSYIVQKNVILEAIGRRSMALFVWHIILFTYFTMILQNFLSQEVMRSLRNLYLAPIFTVIVIVIIFLASFIFEKLRLQLSKGKSD